VGSIKAILSRGASLEVIRNRLKSGEESRTGLARWVCRHFRLQDVRGKPRVSSCLKVLRDFEREGELQLPGRILDIVKHWRVRRQAKPVAKPQEVPAEVGQIQDLQLCLVDPKDDEQMRTWNELMVGEHPQGKRRLVGRQLRYLVGSAHGWLGAVGFSASALSLEARDRWIGWDAQQRQAQEGRVVNLSRLLIRPSVQCQNLASFVLGACVARVEKDFAARYGYEPWLLESFVDGQQHAGTCFQAANWKCVGQTKGRGRNDRTSQFPESIKDIYVYPLVEDFRQRMGMSEEPALRLRPLAVEEGLGAKEWAQQEFGEVELGDQRLRDRLVRIMTDRADHPDASYLEAVGGDRYAVKGYYYFIDSPRESLNPEAMLATHRKRTMQRMMSHPLALVVQDTTDLNFSRRPQTTGLGVVGSNQTGAKSLGLKLHSSVVLTPEGLPLGILRSVAEAPEPKGEGEKQSAGRPMEEKKSFRWVQGLRDCVAAAEEMPETRLLMVADREGDIFELLAEAEATRKRVGVLVRAAHNRRLEGQEEKLWERLQASRNETCLEVTIPRQRSKQAKRNKPEQPGLAARPANLSVRFEKISVAATRSDQRSNSPLTLWGVYVRELEPPPEAKPIEWLLLTTEEIETGQQAAELVGFYSRRWRIEEWHRILKTGCRVEEHQHQTGERLQRAIVLDVVLAWRIQLLTLLGREVPEIPCDVFFDDWEVRVLEALRPPPSPGQGGKRGKRGKGAKGGKEKRPLLLGEAITQVAKLGGYLARGCDPPPGAECLWKGMSRLSGMADGYRLAFTGARMWEPG
jgi:hypothetical protein